MDGLKNKGSEKTEFDRIMEEYMIRDLVSIVSEYLSDTQLGLYGYKSKMINWMEVVNDPLLLYQYICNNPREKHMEKVYVGVINELVRVEEIGLINKILNIEIDEQEKIMITNIIIKIGDREIVKNIINGLLIYERWIWRMCIRMDEPNELIEIAYKRGYKLSKEMFNEVIRGGNINMLEMLYNRGCLYDVTAINVAVEYKRVDIMRWLIQNKFPVREDEVFMNAVKKPIEEDKVRLESEQVDILEIIKLCPYNEEVFDGAICNRNYKAVEWLYNNGYPYGNYIVSTADVNNFIFKLRRIIIESGGVSTGLYSQIQCRIGSILEHRRRYFMRKNGEISENDEIDSDSDNNYEEEIEYLEKVEDMQ